MAQFGGAASAADSRGLDADLPELTARSRAEDNNHRAGALRGSETYKGDDMNTKWKLTSFSLGLVACLATAAAHELGTPLATIARLGRWCRCPD